MEIYVSSYLCRELVEEADNLITLFRTFDKLEVGITGPATSLPPLLWPFYWFTTFRAAGPTTFVATFRVLAPSGKLAGEQTQQLVIQEGKLGHSEKRQVHLNMSDLGMYWFEVLVDGRLAMRLPLEIAHKIVEAPAPLMPNSTTQSEARS